MRNTCCATALALVFSASPATGQGNVWTVDDDGGAAFVAIQPAIDAAAAGDLVLVYDGDYPEFSMLGKGVNVVADQRAAVNIIATEGSQLSVIDGIPLGERALLRGLKFVSPTRNDGDMMHVSNSAGVVWLEDVTIERASLVIHLTPGIGQAINITDCDRVVLVNSTVQGAHASFFATSLSIAHAGVHAVNSNLYMHGSQISAGSQSKPGAGGQVALEIDSGLVILRDSIIVGGVGGGLPGYPSSTGGSGGNGLEVRGDGTVWSIGSDLLPGAPGAGPFGIGLGPPGQPFVVVSGVVHERSAQPTAVIASTVLRDDRLDENLTLDLTSAPNSSAVLLAKLFTSPPAFFGPAVGGFLGVGSNPVVVAAGTTDSSGSLTVEIGIPSLPAGIQTWNGTVQLAALTPAMTLELSNPSVFTVIDG